MMVTPTLSGATEIYLLERENLPAVLVRDSTGIPTLIDQQPVLLRARYISAPDLEIALPIARQQLSSDYRLLAFLPCPDGVPHRTCLCFAFQGDVRGSSWRDGTSPRHGAVLRKWGAATPQGSWIWLEDFRSGRPGYFLTGDSADSSLWRIFRLEADAFNRSIFTLTPVRLTMRLPVADFSSLGDSLRAAEIGAQYHDLCMSVIDHAYRDVVTKARNIVEGLVAGRLGAHGFSSTGRLFDDLRIVKEQLDARKPCGFRDLDYHLAHKIRLLHAQTHVGPTVAAGRPLQPEFALSVVDDLVELLRKWKFCSL